MNLPAIKAIYQFEMARWGRTFLQSIVSPVIATSLYFVVFGAAIGARITEIDNRLPILWDQYRRELATDGREAKSRVAAEKRYNALDTWAPAERSEREEHDPAA